MSSIRLLTPAGPSRARPVRWARPAVPLCGLLVAALAFCQDARAELKPIDVENRSSHEVCVHLGGHGVEPLSFVLYPGGFFPALVEASAGAVEVTAQAPTGRSVTMRLRFGKTAVIVNDGPSQRPIKFLR